MPIGRMFGYQAPAAPQTSYLEPEFAQHYNDWKANPNPTTAGALINKVQPVLKEAIRTYSGALTPSPTLESKTKKLALQAIRGYDPTRAKLRTHLLSQLQGIRRLSAKEEQIINVPEQVLLDANRARESENQLRDKLGRDPSDVELADHTGLSRRRLGYLRTIKPTYAMGKLERVDEEGSSLSQPAVVTEATPTAMATWHDFVYHDLDPIDQQIMEHALGMHGKRVLSNQELAQKLRLSPGAVSQRKAKIQTKLDYRELTGVV